MCIEKHRQGSRSHEENAVLHGESFREGRKTPGEPGINSHIGHNPRSVNETGLGADHKKSAFRKKSNKSQGAAQVPAAEGPVRQNGIQGSALNRFNGK